MPYIKTATGKNLAFKKLSGDNYYNYDEATAEPFETYYYMSGEVNGNCGHKHMTIEDALYCADRTKEEYAKQNLYFDRDPHHIARDLNNDDLSKMSLHFYGVDTTKP
jgi:hypothetical protein